MRPQRVQQFTAFRHRHLRKAHATSAGIKGTVTRNGGFTTKFLHVRTCEQIALLVRVRSLSALPRDGAAG
ncbi:hypothetical protein NOVOSPHI9U_70236 [Novosphingobium sp. 9U]|nr:hypothetical protein NOVOSPHI9U_70236 [Novosphingobium sp. 9U]